MHNDELIRVIEKIFSKLDSVYYATEIEKLVPRYNKCLDKLGDYVEK